MTRRKTREPRGQPLAIDSSAKSAVAGQPAFVAPPKGAPVYYGFPVLEDVCVDEFKLGKITDFEAEPCDDGDAFIVAPDGSRAGLVWDLSDSVTVSEILPPEPRRWGVWAVSFVNPMTSRENARRNLEAILPLLRPKWEDWTKAMNRKGVN